MNTSSVILFVAFVALSWSCGEAQNPNCFNCSNQFIPVCARESSRGTQRQFRNLCYMNQYNCLIGTNYTFVRFGRCLASDGSEIPDNSNETAPLKQANECATCSGNFKLLCGHDETGNSRTFSNACALKRHNCLTGDDYKFAGYGRCLGTKSMSHGETESLDQVKACSTCSRNFKPLCGHDEKGNRRTFLSACALNRHNCLTGDGE
ncbi:ovomucoid-like [Agrilus planipennis]|uniref:Ovomucoid-like n=1 Tax=Agrilus planipennis TaxID=224129 RepID=A0A7F5R3A3_AGRPL|nr:ovomucoid-like [Agrilus planipennis]